MHKVVKTNGSDEAMERALDEWTGKGYSFLQAMRCSTYDVRLFFRRGVDGN
ncbi:hypothetical protein [Sinorhizobium fredii]|uniref:hypothetical protein n=1 Tax=Rhizobium fredii TaxID=380 RepID=UPI0035118CD0